MSVLFGVIALDGREIEAERFDRVVSESNYWNADKVSVWRSRGARFACLANQVLPESQGEKQPLWRAETSTVLLADARIDNRDDLLLKLGISKKDGYSLSDAALLHFGYEKWGAELCSQLYGDFAFAVWEARKKRLFLARDQLGVKSLLFARVGNQFAFASELAPLAAYFSGQLATNHHWFLNCICSIYLPDTRPMTAFKEASRLLGGHWMSVSEEQMRVQRYWKLTPAHDFQSGSIESFLEGYRERLQRAIADRLRGVGPVACEVSAGLDSQSIYSFAHRQASSVFALSHGISSARGEEADVFYDEFADTARYCSQQGIAVPFKVDGERESLNTLFAAANRQRGSATMENWAVYSNPLYKRASEGGARVLLSGAGGDDLATSQASLALLSLGRRLKWGRLWEEVSKEGALNGSSLLRCLARFLSSAGGGFFPETLANFKQRSIRTENTNPFLRRECISEHELVQRAREYWRSLVRASLHDQMEFRVSELYLDRGRLPESSIAARSHGIELRYPLLDLRLLEFCFAGAEFAFRKNGFGRYPIRAITSGLPDELRWGRKLRVPSIPWVGQLYWRQRAWLNELFATAKGHGLYSELYDPNSIGLNGAGLTQLSELTDPSLRMTWPKAAIIAYQSINSSVADSS